MKLVSGCVICGYWLMKSDLVFYFFLLFVFLENMGKNRILIKGCNIAVGSNRGVFLPKLFTHIDISEGFKSYLRGLDGGGHGIKTSRNVNISRKSPRIPSKTLRTRGPHPKVNSMFVSLERRVKTTPKPLLETLYYLLLLPQNRTNLTS